MLNINNKYGYKVCYRENGCKQFKIKLITNTYDGALWHLEKYKKHHTKLLWCLIAVKTKREYIKLWKDCPF